MCLFHETGHHTQHQNDSNGITTNWTDGENYVPSLSAIDSARSIILAARERAKLIEAQEADRSTRRLAELETKFEYEIKTDLIKFLDQISSDVKRFKTSLEELSLITLKSILLSFLEDLDGNYQSIIENRLKHALDLNLASKDIEISVSPGDYQIFETIIRSRLKLTIKSQLLENNSLPSGSFVIKLGTIKLSYNIPEQISKIRDAIHHEIKGNHENY